jgi:ribonucleotide monophosphatase NagD (HAD superfamily)
VLERFAIHTMQKIARQYAAALIDLSGTLHIEDLAIPGAVDAMRR